MTILIPLIPEKKEKEKEPLIRFSVFDTSTMGQISFHFTLNNPHQSVMKCLTALGITHKIDYGSLTWYREGVNHTIDEAVKENMNIIIRNVVAVMKNAGFSIKSVLVGGSFYLTDKLRNDLQCTTFEEKPSNYVQPMLIVQFEKA